METKTCNLSIYTMDHPNIIVSNKIENSIGQKQVNRKLKTFLIQHNIIQVLHYSKHTRITLEVLLTIMTC